MVCSATLLLFAATARLTSAVEIAVGGAELGWTDWTCYEPITNVRVGDTLYFRATGAHDVFRMASEKNLDACDFAGGERLASAGADATYTVTEEDAAAGGVYFTCTIGVHCERHLQKLKAEVVVGGTVEVPSGSEYVTGGLEVLGGTPYDEACALAAAGPAPTPSPTEVAFAPEDAFVVSEECVIPCLQYDPDIFSPCNKGVVGDCLCPLFEGADGYCAFGCTDDDLWNIVCTDDETNLLTDSTPVTEIPIEWFIPGPAGLPNVTAEVGNVLVFEWEFFHNVYIAPDGCDTAFGIGSSLGESSPVRYTVQEEDVGTMTFACGVPGHCAAGQLLEVTIPAPPTPPPAPVVADALGGGGGPGFAFEEACVPVCPAKEISMFTPCDANFVGDCLCPLFEGSDSYCAFTCADNQWVVLCMDVPAEPTMEPAPTPKPTRVPTRVPTTPAPTPEPVPTSAPSGSPPTVVGPCDNDPSVESFICDFVATSPSDLCDFSLTDGRKAREACREVCGCADEAEPSPSGLRGTPAPVPAANLDDD